MSKKIEHNTTVDQATDMFLTIYAKVDQQKLKC